MLQIYNKHFKEVAIHQICTSQGEFITNQKESLIGASIAGGFANDLSIYDKLTGGLI